MPFVKGDPRINRNGRRVGSGLKLTTLLSRALERIPEGKKEAYKDIFIQTLIDKAIIEKDIHSIKLIFNYLEGLPKQHLEVSGRLEVDKDDVAEAAKAVNEYLNANHKNPNK